MSRFSPGDRVEFIYKYSVNNGRLTTGSIGTVVALRTASDLSVGVAWDEKMGGHSLGGKCPVGYGWWVNDGHIAPYSEEQFEPAGEDELIRFLFN